MRLSGLLISHPDLFKCFFAVYDFAPVGLFDSHGDIAAKLFEFFCIRSIFFNHYNHLAFPRRNILGNLSDQFPIGSNDSLRFHGLYDYSSKIGMFCFNQMIQKDIIDSYPKLRHFQHFHHSGKIDVADGTNQDAPDRAKSKQPGHSQQDSPSSRVFHGEAHHRRGQ